MGGSSKRQTVGYRYYLGMHLVLCHGPVDFVRRIDVDNREAWLGNSPGGTITINKPNLFGGEDREGGISGSVDIAPGGPTQGVNSYLAARLGSSTPAFRGVLSVILKQVFLGLNPYLKNWSFRVQRVLTTSSGQPQWYAEKAPIGTITDEPLNLYFALDFSSSMRDIASNGQTRLANMKTAMYGVLDFIEDFLTDGALDQVDIILVAYGNPDDVRQSTTRRNVDAEDIAFLKSWLSSNNVNYGTTYPSGVVDAEAFFNGSPEGRDILFFISDGFPSDGVDTSEELATETAVRIAALTRPPAVYCINIDLEDTQYMEYFDNTPSDGIPVVSGGDPSALQAVIVSALSGQIDMNPAHIIRECLTDNVWGMGYNEVDMDEVSFTAAADRLFSEALGISLLWDRQTPLEEFIQEILKHIDGVLRVNRRTGKFELKLIRDDYDENELLVLDPSNVQKIESFSRPSFGELVNSVTVNYWDFKTGTPASLTVQDIALVAVQGSTINTTVQYPGITNSLIASRLAGRDLKTLSNPLLSCVVYCDQSAKELNVGDVFKLTWPDYHVEELVLRVTSIAYGNGRSNRIKLQAAQDVFSLPEAVIDDESQEDLWVDPSQPPIPTQDRLLVEATYFELLQNFGQTQLTEELTALEEMGYFVTTAQKPSEGVINMNLRVDSGAGYEESGVVDFCPTGTLVGAIGKFETEIELTNLIDEDVIATGNRAYLNDELLEILDFDPDTQIVSLKRGILDTVPAEHEAGSIIYFSENYAEGDEVQYVDGDVINVKLLPTSGAGTVLEASAPAEAIELDARAIRPFRPANLRAFGELDPDPLFYPDYPVAITWVARNRLQETTVNYLSWTDAGVTPEAGTEYRVLVEAIASDNSVDGVVVDTVVASSPYSLTGETIGVTWAGSPLMRVTVWAIRDGFQSWQGASVQFPGPFREPDNLFGVYRDPKAPEDLTGLVIE